MTYTKIICNYPNLDSVIRISTLGLTYREYAEILNENQIGISCSKADTIMTKYIQVKPSFKLDCNKPNATTAYFRKLSDVDQLSFAEIDSWSLPLFDMIEK